MNDYLSEILFLVCGIPTIAVIAVGIAFLVTCILFSVNARKEKQ